MLKPHHVAEWQQSGIEQSLIELNLSSLEEEPIAEWYFQYLPKNARRNDGRIRDGYLRAYAEPLKGGWGISGYDPTDWQAEPELRSFKPDSPRIGKDGKPIKYDIPKNAKHNPILPRVSYAIASLIFRNAGLNFLELTQDYAPEEIAEGIEDNAECRWFWQAIANNPTVPISLTEGGKKCLSLLAQGRCALAVTSITTWRAERGSNKLHPWLSLFAPNRHFYLTFDQDIKPKTIRAVNGQCVRLGAALVKAGAARVRRISWSGAAKGIDDFIAKLQEKYGARYLQKILRKCYQNARDYRRFNQSSRLPGTTLTVNKQYLSPEDLKKAAGFKILVVKSAKGTGKTSVLSDLVASDRFTGTPTINLSHLERLARELGVRLDLPYRTAENTTSLRNSWGYSLCIDSFSPENSIPFHAEQWSDAGLAIDEFTQVLHHLTFGTTEIKKNRKLVLRELGQKLADCWSQNKPIRLLDADANTESIELIYELIQLYSDREISREELEASTLTLVNQYQPKKGDLHLYDEPSPKQIRADLITRMKRQDNLFILSSSQKSRSGDGTINLEKLAKKHYKSEQILRIDSQTTSDPEHPAFGISGDNLSKLIKAGKYKVIIASPTICTGISIDEVDNYFDAVFSFQSGNITPNSVRQQLVRLRDFQVPRYLWCSKVGKSFVGSKSSNPIELLTDQKGEAKLSLSLLGFREAEQLIESNICPLTKYWAKVGAKNNGINYHYREILLADLEAEGWNVIVEQPDLKSEKSKLAWQERREIQNDSFLDEVNLIDQAKDLTEKEVQKIERSRTRTRTQSAQLAKYQIKQRYGVDEVSKELIEADTQKLYPALRLRFWLTVGREHLEDSDRALVEKHIERNHGSFFIPDLNNSCSITKVKLLELLNPYLEKINLAGSEWSNKSPQLTKLKKFVLKDLVRLNQVLRCGIAETDSPITVVQKILKVIGLKLPCLRNERDGKKRLRIYGSAVSKFRELHHLENQILDNWFKAAKKTDYKRQKAYTAREIA
ncbi:MAG: DUF3854 domain-containing protein [Pleurocapsa sp. MO_226.B13]|nr:DUF3854 domain-containing protein [Pleurocapsa sp. MO_226.B13]